MFKKGKSKKNVGEAIEMPVANVLLKGSYYDFNVFAGHFKRKWRYFDHVPYRDKDAVGMVVGGTIFGCKFTPAPINDPELEEHAKNSVLWPGAEEYVRRHNAHLSVALAQEKDAISAHSLLSKVIYSLAHQKNVEAIHFGSGFFEPTYYVKCAETLVSRKLPTELWVNIKSPDFGNDKKVSFYTDGMHRFGKPEFEVVGMTGKNFIDVYYIIKNAVNHAIEKNILFKDGDVIGEGVDKNYLEVSDGVYVDGLSVKILRK